MRTVPDEDGTVWREVGDDVVPLEAVT